MPQSVQRASSREQNWPPLVCICGLCECGGHKCSDFNEWLAAQERNSTTPLDGEHEAACANSHGHSCNYTRPAFLEERYLTRNSSSGNNQQQHLSGQKRDTDKATSFGDAAQPTATRSQTRDNNEDDEVLHVLVTRPQVASKPRDNIVFEGDMDLRTTFETSYEALARTRLEHWKRHQELKTRGQRSETAGWQDVSDETGGHCRQTATGTPISRSGDNHRELHSSPTCWAPPSERMRDYGENEDERAPGQLDDVDAGSIGSRDEGLIDASVPKDRPTNAAVIRPPTRFRTDAGADQSAESKQQRRPLVFGPALSLDQGDRGRPAAGASPQPPLAALTTEQRKHQQHRRRQDHFIDPDLSPIIVYDANLNRLERVGLRKRSKYRPSTSLRPGGRDFFGPVESDDHERAKQNGQIDPIATPTDTDEPTGADHRGRQKRGANSMELNESDELVGRTPASLNSVDHHGLAAGASSETLNKGQSDCGRKHNLAHINRIDHIKQMNLVENSYPAARQSTDLATLTNGDTQSGNQQDRQVNFVESGHGEMKSSVDEHERKLTEQEEDAAVAEIQRLVVDGDEYRVAHRIQPGLASSRQSNRLVKQTTVASPSEMSAAAPTPVREQMISPASSRGDGKISSRQSRMERVCQNQSFFLFENDYPETRSGALDDKRCIKIGGRQTVELSRPALDQQTQRTSSQNAHVKQNLFRESPDFIMTTGQLQARLPPVEDQPKQQRPSKASQIETTDLKGTQTGTQHKTVKQKSQESEESDHWDSKLDETRKCRVLDLGNHFEFVGSRSGHKYFVEKNIISTPISEMG